MFTPWGVYSIISSDDGSASPRSVTFTAPGSSSAAGEVSIVPEARIVPPASVVARASWMVNMFVEESSVNQALTSAMGTRSYAALMSGCVALPASSASSARVRGSGTYSAGADGAPHGTLVGPGAVSFAVPEKTGKSSGPVTEISPPTFPAIGKAEGRAPRVAESAFTSTPGTCAEIL